MCVMTYVLPNGADVEVKGKEDTQVYDRVEITDSGMVVCINKSGYQVDCYPQERIHSMHTFTEHLEDEGWW